MNRRTQLIAFGLRLALRGIQKDWADDIVEHLLIATIKPEPKPAGKSPYIQVPYIQVPMNGTACGWRFPRTGWLPPIKYGADEIRDIVNGWGPRNQFSDDFSQRWFGVSTAQVVAFWKHLDNPRAYRYPV